MAPAPMPSPEPAPSPAPARRPRPEPAAAEAWSEPAAVPAPPSAGRPAWIYALPVVALVALGSVAVLWMRPSGGEGPAAQPSAQPGTGSTTQPTVAGGGSTPAPGTDEGPIKEEFIEVDTTRPSPSMAPTVAQAPTPAAAPPTLPTIALKPTPTPAPVKVADAGVPAPPAGGPPATTAKAPLAPPPPPVTARTFAVGKTLVQGKPKGGKGPAGFDTGGLAVTEKPEFEGSVFIEASPAAVRPGDAYTLRIFLRNDGKKEAKLQTVRVTTSKNGRRTPTDVPLRTKELAPQARMQIHEIAGTWEEGVTAWSLEVLVTTAKGDTWKNSVSLK